MNWQTGLERVSVAWWGFLGLIAVGSIAAALFGNSPDRFAMAAIGFGALVAVYVAHRITCWIVAGFFAPRS